MTDSSKELEVFDLLVRQEEAAAGFYRRCASRFPSNTGFWVSLAEAEEKHVQFLRGIAAQPGEAEAFVSRRRITAAPLKQLLAAMKKKTDAVQSTSTTQLWALETAHRIENSIVENLVLSPVRGDPDALVQTIRRVNAETHSHAVKIESALAELRKNLPR